MLTTAILFGVQYYFIIQFEEEILTRKFGDEYLKYRRRVPAFFPSSMPKLDSLEWPRQIAPAIRSEKRTLTTIFALLFFLTTLA